MKEIKGQTLIEVLIALAIAILVVAAIAIVILSALNNAQFSKNQNNASQYAQQGMEIVRNLRSSNWSSFKNLAADPANNKYCLDKGHTTLQKTGSLENDIRNGNAGCQGIGSEHASGQNVDNYAREVDLENPGTLPCAVSEIKATVIVSWADTKCTDANNVYCHKAQIVSCFSTGNILPTL
ncbi:MAG: prepilin-type N-terminal cleavage/methylation domain-containing protein [Candidatus Levybacteria bacterium]|nr:prepilin-type N-terminal cleavage/methylation domain-containing protein [Candidatus Levybacteria bacterium]